VSKDFAAESFPYWQNIIFILSFWVLINHQKKLRDNKSNLFPLSKTLSS